MNPRSWPIVFFDALRIVQIVLATVFVGMFTKVVVLRLRDRPVTTTHPLVVVAVLILVVTTPFEHILRIGMEPTWRIPVHIAGYLLGIIGLMKTRTMHVSKPEWKRTRGA